MSKPHDNRPLSPFMLGQYYRFQITSALSILHRITGFGLTLGLVLFTLWLWGAAFSPELFECVRGFMGSLLGLLFLIGWTWAFYYHLGNGIRHLNWDIGRGFSLPEVTSSGWVVVVFSVAMTIFTWAIVARNGGIYAS